jgi:serine phosphatase RsbU (regulator of sigma subunit)
VKYVLDITEQVRQERELQEALNVKQEHEEELRQNLEEMATINDELTLKTQTIDELVQELRLKNAALEEAKRLVEQRADVAESAVVESIQYAKRIQEALIPDVQQMQALAPSSYQLDVMFQPRDIVSGDFYFVGQWRHRTVVAIGDGTGHGVPGAFMSLIGINALQKLVERGITVPGLLLEEMDAEVRTVLQRGSLKVNDTLEVIVAVMDSLTNTLRISSANRPIFLFRNQQLEEIAADKLSVGGEGGREKIFTEHIIQMQPGDTFYLMSDGIADQFGHSERGERRLGRKALRETLQELSALPFAQRLPALQQQLAEWRGENLAQTDDIVCLALRYQ